MGADALFYRLVPAMAIALACCTVSATEHSPPAQPAASAGSISMLPSHLPLRRDAVGASERLTWSPSISLLAVVGAAGAGMFWWRSVRARRALGSARPETAAVVRLSSLALTPQASVHAVRWNGEDFLVGCTAQSVTLLSRRSGEGASGEHA